MQAAKGAEAPTRRTPPAAMRHLVPAAAKFVSCVRQSEDGTAGDIAVEWKTSRLAARGAIDLMLADLQAAGFSIHACAGMSWRAEKSGCKGRHLVIEELDIKIVREFCLASDEELGIFTTPPLT